MAVLSKSEAAPDSSPANHDPLKVADMAGEVVYLVRALSMAIEFATDGPERQALAHLAMIAEARAEEVRDHLNGTLLDHHQN